MAETGQKISALQAATSAADADVLAGVQSSATKKFPMSILYAYIKSKLTPSDIGAATAAAVEAKADQSVVGAEYSAASTYATGDFCLYNGALYRCAYPITTPEAWTASHWEQTTIAAELQAMATYHIYGFHVNGAESDPATAVTYLADAVGMTPAGMDYVNGSFVWGSWRNAFFMPRPCMLKSNGTVDYYLDPNDYSKKEDGTASDVANDAYDGNAMMEWGRDGRKIWYKIVPDVDDNTSASIFVADWKADDDFRAWPFINNQGLLVDHFYTPIYNGSVDTNGKLRSISGKAYTDLCQGKTAAEEAAAAELNNPSTDKLWYTEVYSDVTLINILLILMAKTLDTQTAYGNGRVGQASAASSMLGTGTLDNAGLFFGYNDSTHANKIFGMENWWGNQNRRYAGHVMSGYVQMYKMTRGRQDGSAADDYSQSTTAADYSGYLTGATGPSTNDYIKEMQFDTKCFQPKTVGGTSATYWADFWYPNSGLRYAHRGGSANVAVENAGAFYQRFYAAPSGAFWYIGAAPSCKPLA